MKSHIPPLSRVYASSHAGSYTNLVVYSVSESWLAKVVLRTRSARPPCSVRLRRTGASVRSQSSSEITHEQAFATSPWRTLRRLSRSVFDLPLASRRVVCYAGELQHHGTSDVTYGSWAPTQGFVTSIILMEAVRTSGAKVVSRTRQAAKFGGQLFGLN